MAQPARTARLAALFILITCSLLAPPIIAQEKQDPPPPAAVRPALDKAAQLEKAGKPLEAIVVLEKRLAGLPRDAPTAERRALSLALADRYAALAAKATQSGQGNEAVAWYKKALALHRVFNKEAAAMDLKKIGNVYYSRSEYDKALEYFNQALPLFRQVGNKLQEGSTLNNIGSAYASLSQFDKVLDFYNQALTIYKRLDNKSGEASTLFNIGNVYYILAQYDKVLVVGKQALAIFRSLGDKQREADTLTNIGRAYASLSQYGKAMDYYNQALTDYRQLSDKEGEAGALNDIGRAYDELAEYVKALSCYNQALIIYRRLGDKLGQANALNNIGLIYQTLSQYSRALESNNQALTIYRQLGDKAGEARGLNNIGRVSYLLAEYDKALEFFNLALPIQKAIGDDSGEATTLNNIGDTYLSLAQYTRALEFSNQALALFRQVGDKAGEGSTLIVIGNIYYALAQFSKAQDCFNQALALYRQRGDKSGEGNALNNIGNIYYLLSQYSKALDFYTQALAIYKRLNDPQREANRQGEAGALHNVGRVYIELSQYDKALAFGNQALAIFRRIKDKEGEAVALHTIADTYDKLSQYSRAAEFFNQALTIYRRISDTAGEADILKHLMNVYDHTKNPSLAIWYGKQAVNLYQIIRGTILTLDKEAQQSFVNGVEGTYRHLADLLISQGRLMEAQQVLDLLKQQEYFTFIRRSPAEADATNGTADLTPAEAEAEKKYRAVSDRAVTVATEYETLLKKPSRTETEEKHLDALFKELAEANAAFQAFLAGLEKEFAENKVVANRLDTVKDAEALTTTLARLDEETGQKTVAVYTLVGEKSLRVLVITGGVQVARTADIGAADLAKKVFTFRAALKNPRLDPRPLGKELYDLIVRPIEKDLAGANAATVLWSLDSVLRYIPITALSPDGKTYLAERDIRHSLFTPATLSRLVDTPKADWKALAVGVSKPYEVEGVHFNALAGAESEVNGVEALLPGRILMNADFNETALVRALRDGYPLVHVATHFYFRPGDEGRSFLLLGDGTALSLAHLREMPATLFKGVDLLVLSACDTATGGGEDPSATGAEFESFGLLAQRKGAEAVLATLWPVADASTVLLMQEFYRIRKATPGLSKAAALRQAQIALLTGKVTPPPFTGPESIKGVAASTESEAASNAPAYVPDPRRPYAHPYYWAGFILIGNFR